MSEMPAGWYPLPSEPGKTAYWDGTAWATGPVVGPLPPPPPKATVGRRTAAGITDVLLGALSGVLWFGGLVFVAVTVFLVTATLVDSADPLWWAIESFLWGVIGIPVAAIIGGCVGLGKTLNRRTRTLGKRMTGIEPGP